MSTIPAVPAVPAVPAGKKAEVAEAPVGPTTREKPVETVFISEFPEITVWVRPDLKTTVVVDGIPTVIKTAGCKMSFRNHIARLSGKDAEEAMDTTKHYKHEFYTVEDIKTMRKVDPKRARKWLTMLAKRQYMHNGPPLKEWEDIVGKYLISA